MIADVDIQLYSEVKRRSEATQILLTGCSKADPQTDTQTDRGDYNTLHSLAALNAVAVMAGWWLQPFSAAKSHLIQDSAQPSG